jgi:hypothetical protein
MKHVFPVLACASGCVAAVDGSMQPAPEPGFGIVAQPRLGTVVTEPTSSASILFSGVHERPAYRIDIQVYAGEWITIASTTTGTVESSTDYKTYEWSVVAAPAQLIPSRWPQGGIVRVRAIGAEGEVLASLFHDSDACLDENVGWRDRAEYCGAVLDSIVLVSAADVTATPDRPRFLDAHGPIEATETARYYQEIGAPNTLASFRTQFGLGAAAPTSTFYNAHDLSIGREAQCAAQADGSVACTIANYGQFGGPVREALDRAVDRTGALSTFAMVYSKGAATNPVQFIVYGPDGALATTAQLDTVADNQGIPNSCLNCHGADATYDPITHTVRGASFLPFAATAYTYSTRLGFSEPDEVGGFARLNQLVRATEPTTATRELIDGWYPDAAADGPPADFIPLAWTSSPLERQVYRYVVGETCYGCHFSRRDDLTFAEADAFRARSATIERIVCDDHSMPNAQVPLQRMWNGPARAYLAAYLELDSCDP